MYLCSPGGAALLGASGCRFAVLSVSSTVEVIISANGGCPSAYCTSHDHEVAFAWFPVPWPERADLHPSPLK